MMFNGSSRQPAASSHRQPQGGRDRRIYRKRGIPSFVTPSHPPVGSSCAAGPGSAGRSARDRISAYI